MVDVGDKEPTRRVAVAACELHVSARLLRLLRDARLPKGDALTVAQVAGALGAKRTSDLLHKSGGRSDGIAPPPPPPVRPLGAEPRPPRDTEGETYAPTDVAHF